MFWMRKNKKIVVDAYTQDAMANKYFRLKASSEVSKNSNDTFLYEQGFVLPLWYDFESFIKGNLFKDYFYTFHYNYNLLENHYYNLNMHFSKDILFTMPTPWYLHTEEPLEWLVVQSTNFEHFTIPTKTQNFCFNHILNLEMLVPNEEKVFNLSVNTPMVNLIPLTDKEVVFNFHYDIDMVEQLARRSEPIAFTGGEYIKRDLYGGNL